MLEHFIDLEFKARRLCSGTAGEYMDSFADCLQSSGYRRRPAQLLLRGAAHFSEWAATQHASVEQFDAQLLASFVEHVQACACTHPFHGQSRYHGQGAKRLIEYLRSRGIVAPAERAVEPQLVVVGRFRDWMRAHRGARESTIRQYVRIVKEFLGALGEDTARYDAGSIRNFVLAKSSHIGCSGAKSVANASRMFLRFLSTTGCCSSDLVESIPKLAHWKLESLPRYVSAEDIERLVGVCNSGALEGARDRAIILLLARLALRAGDIWNLRLPDIDWVHARVRVAGKARAEARLPLPQDVGDAILHYVEHFRPYTDDDHLFLRIRPPFGALPSSGSISKIVRRAILRAGIQTPSLGAHLLRHSSATAMLRQGASLDVIGAVLRHRSVETTAHYAKVDLELLHSVAQPWPVTGGPAC